MHDLSRLFLYPSDDKAHSEVTSYNQDPDFDRFSEAQQSPDLSWLHYDTTEVRFKTGKFREN